MLPETMKALVAKSATHYECCSVPVPEVGDDDILIKVEACGVCAGDIKASHGTSRFWGGDGMPGFCKPPFIPGHEFFGRVAAVGKNKASEYKVGDRVISEQIVPCGECYYCKRGMYWLCDPHDVYGFKNYLNGGMAEYALLPKGSINYKVPEDMPVEKAVLIEPLACSLHGVQQANATKDDVVVLAGAGALGLGMVNALRLIGVKKLIVLDLIDARLELAKKYGADVVLNPKKCDLLKEIQDMTEGVGCDIYIEATGHPASVQQGLDIIRKGGRFVEFSVMSGPSTIDWSIIGDAKEITIVGSQLSPYCYEPVIKYLDSGEFNTEGMITHQFSVEQWEEAYKTAQTLDALKVIIRP